MVAYWASILFQPQRVCRVKVNSISKDPCNEMSLCMSYCVTDGDESAKAPATKKTLVMKCHSMSVETEWLTPSHRYL